VDARRRPRTVLWPRITIRRWKSGQRRIRPTLTAIPAPGVAVAHRLGPVWLVAHHSGGSGELGRAATSRRARKEASGSGGLFGGTSRLKASETQAVWPSVTATGCTGRSLQRRISDSAGA